MFIIIGERKLETYDPVIQKAWIIVIVGVKHPKSGRKFRIMEQTEQGLSCGGMKDVKKK